MGMTQDHSKSVREPLPSAEAIAGLPPDGGPLFNRLIFSQSPYLLQHARNPVDWWPWGDEAFAAAKEQGKPVFLSIGYSTCHWCLVMEHESFEDEEVAALMNEAFICIKVDREERPDVDHVYMTVTQAMTGRGGWPMTVILTPEREAFYAGTYFPKGQLGQRPGMMQLVPALRKAWDENHEQVIAEAGKITEFLKHHSAARPGSALGAETLDLAEQQLSSRFDEQRGGFSEAPKFPIPHNLRFLLRRHARTKNPKTLQQVTKTLREMRLGGIWDHVGFGFHRYSTDSDWLVPHFEKMLYDQALLAMAYTEAWQVSQEPLLQQTAEEILAYVMRDMTDPLGGFYSAEDADSEGEEGLFYLWTVDELQEILGEEDGSLAAKVWNASNPGNFREEASRKVGTNNIPHLSKPLVELAAQFEMEPEVLTGRMEKIRERLFEARKERIHPLKDDKVLSDWNGLMIAAFSMAGRAMQEQSYVDTAVRAAEFAWSELRDQETGRLYKRWRAGQAGLDGMLEDYAFLAWGLLELFETTQDPRWLARSRELVDLTIQHFQAEGGGFHLSPDDGEALIVRAKEVYDGAIPSGNSVMAWNLVRLARLTVHTPYEEQAVEILKAFSGQVGSNASAHTQLMCALDFLEGPSQEIVVVGDPEAADTQAMLKSLGTSFFPHAVVIQVPSQGSAEIAALAPYTAEQKSIDGQATAYVCQDFTCQAPVVSVEAMLANIGRLQVARTKK